MSQPPRAHRFIRYQFPAILWGTIIFVSSSLPVDRLPKIGLLTADKILHFVVFFVFSALIHRAIKFQARYPAVSRHSLALTVAITVAYGVFDEIHQYFVPGRDSSLYDLLADALGALLYIGMAWLWTRRRAGGTSPGASG